jgi:hypothetical protein
VAHNLANQGSKQVESKPKTYPNQPNSVHNQHRPTLEDQRRPHDKVGLKVAQQGCRRTHGAAAPMLAWLEPNLARSVQTNIPKVVHKVTPRFNVP